MVPERIPLLLGPFTWPVQPHEVDASQPGAISITAGPLSDLFSNPNGSESQANSPRGITDPGRGDFMLSARVRVSFVSTFDAGVLLIWQNADWWAKLCFEFSLQGQPMIVSVVTRDGASDDCNSAPIQGETVYLRLARIGSTFAFHYSSDGAYWHMVRYFTLERPDQVSVGFSAQSPRGQACTASFSSISFRRETLSDMRSGV